MKGGGGGGGGCFGIFIAMVLLGLLIQYWYIVLGLIVVGIAIWGFIAWQDSAQQNENRRRHWAKLDHRFQALCTHVGQHEADPQRALATPAWLDESNPLVRSYATAVADAQQRRQEIAYDSRYTMSAVAPSRVSEAQLGAFEKVVDQLAESFEEIDQALRLTGWAQHDHRGAPHPQFLLDQRWGEPAILPARVILDGAHGQDKVRRFLDDAYPINRADALATLTAHGIGRLAGGRTLPTVIAQYAVEDADGFLWPQWVDVDNWGVHRTFGPEADLTVFDAASVEIANAIWGMLDGTSMTEQEIGEGLVEQLGLTDFPDAIPLTRRRGDSLVRRTALWNRVVTEAVHTGLLTERLQRGFDGTIGRGRRSWPPTYRTSS